MAVLKFDFFSKCLMRTVPCTAIVPVDKLVSSGELVQKKTFKTLYLLHGVFGNCNDWLTGTRIERFAGERDLAVIMPSGDNKFYVNNAVTGEKYMEFIGKELVEVSRALFPLSEKREDTFIAGLSMGGYGAIVNGLNFSDTFGCIVGLSSALVVDQAITAKDGDITAIHSKQFYQSVFGDLRQLLGSEKDYKAMIIKLQEQNKKIPRIYLTCGTEDFLIRENRNYRDFLMGKKVELTYIEAPGRHDWDFWDSQIKNVLDWLPLLEVNVGINSGNVK